MKSHTKQLFLSVLLLMLFQFKTTAQVYFGLKVTGNKLTVTYVPDSSYTTSPANLWNKQVFSIKYTGGTVNWSNLQNLSGFTFVEDTTTIPPFGVLQYYIPNYYKIFYADSTGVPVNLTKGVPLDVMSIDISSLSNITFDFATPFKWIVLHNGIARSFNVGTNNNEFKGFVNIGNKKFDAFPPVGIITTTSPSPTSTSTIPVNIDFSEPVRGLTESDLYLFNGTASPLVTTDSIHFTTNITPQRCGKVYVGLPAGTCQDTFGNNNLLSTQLVTEYRHIANALGTYLLEEMNDGFYKVSLVTHVGYRASNAITSTAQVTLKVGTSTSKIDSFNVTDLTMLNSNVVWAQNSRYNAPSEEPTKDYISFGLKSNGTSDIPYLTCDTVPLFKFRNTGICSEDSIYLMPIDGDPFEWPNSLKANVGQQLSVSGYDDPDLPLSVSGMASCMADVTFDFKTILQGAYNPTVDLMNDSLRALLLIPSIEPYSEYRPIRTSNFKPFVQVNGGGESFNAASIYNTTGPDAIVDWVFLELRNQHDSSKVLATHSALLQRDGDIKDSTGTGYVTFRKLHSDKYFFSVRHRNHLGLMSATKIPLVNTVNQFDFTSKDSVLHGSNAGYMIGGKRVMWAGNSNGDPYIMFQGGGIGEGLDHDNVFDNMMTDPKNTNYTSNHVSVGYYPGDNNLDGKVKYQGPANDIDPFIFFNIMSRHPENTSKMVNYYITDKLPH